MKAQTDPKKAARTATWHSSSELKVPKTSTRLTGTERETLQVMAVLSDSDYLTIVSGLPRSGTSLMMQALMAGGMAPVTDGLRCADTHNPRGYFEHEAVKSLASESSWLGSHLGQAVKIIYRLLPYVPESIEARVIFMRRNLLEIVTSQNKMLDGMGTQQWEILFQQEMDKYLPLIHRRPHFRVLELDFAELIEQPKSIFPQVTDFLERELDLDAMCSVVEPRLYRNRVGSIVS